MLGSPIELETQACGLLLLDKAVIVGCVDNVIHSYHIKGKKNWSIYLPEPITNIQLMQLRRKKSLSLILVAMASGDVRMYNGKSLVR